MDHEHLQESQLRIFLKVLGIKAGQTVPFSVVRTSNGESLLHGHLRFDESFFNWESAWNKEYSVLADEMKSTSITKALWRCRYKWNPSSMHLELFGIDSNKIKGLDCLHPLPSDIVSSLFEDSRREKALKEIEVRSRFGDKTEVTFREAISWRAPDTDIKMIPDMEKRLKSLMLEESVAPYCDLGLDEMFLLDLHHPDSAHSKLLTRLFLETFDKLSPDQAKKLVSLPPAPKDFKPSFTIKPKRAGREKPIENRSSEKDESQ